MQNSSHLISHDNIAVIPETDAAKTVALTRCDACGFELFDHNKFCRRCGARQLTGSITSAPLDTGQSLSRCATSSFATSDIRGSLFMAVESASLTARLGNPVARVLVAALFAVSVWLVIILLSPLNAWAAAKSAVNRTRALSMDDPGRTLYSET